MSKPKIDAVECVLCEDGRSVMIEAFNGDHSLGMWSFDLGSTRPDFDEHKAASAAFRFMQKAHGQKWRDHLAAWLRSH